MFSAFKSDQALIIKHDHKQISHFFENERKIDPDEHETRIQFFEKLLKV